MGKHMQVIEIPHFTMIATLLSISTLILMIAVIIIVHKISKHMKTLSSKVSSMSESMEKTLGITGKMAELSDAVESIRRRLASLSIKDIEESIFDLTRVLQKMSQLLSQQAITSHRRTIPVEREPEIQIPTEMTSIDELSPIVVFRYDGTVVEYSGIEQPTKKVAYIVESIRSLDEAEVKNDVILMPEIAVLKLPMGLYAAIFKRINNVDHALKIREVLSKYVEGYRGS